MSSIETHPARRRVLAAAAGIAIACAMAFTTVGVDTASANVPSSADRMDAKRFARNYWENWRGEDKVCVGWLDMIFQPMKDPATMAYVTKMVGGHTLCTVHYNSRYRWDWDTLCAVTIHEVGHLLGYRHTRPGPSIMSPRYPNPMWGTRFKACEAAS